MNWFCRLLAIAAAFLVSSPAAAQERTAPVPGSQQVSGDSISYSTWAIDGEVVRLQVMLPVSEADKLPRPHGQVRDASAVSDAVSAAFSASSAGRPCSVVDQGEGEGKIYRLALTPGIERFEMIFLCASPTRIAISDNLLFNRIPGHINFARVQVGAKPPFVEMFTRNHREFDVQAAQRARDSTGLFSFFKQGALNLLRHGDLLLLLAGIVLFCTRRRDLFLVAAGVIAGGCVATALAIGGFALGSPMLAGATAGLVVAGLGAAALRLRNAGAPMARGWKIAIAFSYGLAVIGAIAVADRAGPVAVGAIAGICLVCLAMMAGALASGPPHWLTWFPAFLLGLLSGMAITTNLAVLSMPAIGTLGPLAGWMLGVTTGATAFAALVMFIFWSIGRRQLSWGNLAKEVMGATLVGAGLFWFVSRVWT
jgi:hypothetical protein